MSRQYLYAIIARPAPEEADAPAVPADENDLRTICYRDLAAVVSDAPADAGSIYTREEAVHRLLAHQRVVERVMRNCTVLPVKFGTILSDEAAVARVLSHGQELFRRRLDELSRHTQIELVVTWSLEKVLNEVAAEDRIARYRAEIASPPGAACEAEQIELGRMVKGSLDRRRAQIATRIADALKPLASDMVENALLDDRMVVNFALLVAADAAPQLDELIEELDRKLEGRFNFRSVGPLPPYSFATVELAQPSFDAIDRARQTLNLGEQARPGEIKSAYRRWLQQIHPDVSSSPDASDERVAELVQAYKLLMSYASARKNAAKDELDNGKAGVFGREAVESTIMIAVRRQNPAAQFEGTYA